MRYLYSPLFLFIILCYTRSIVFLVCTVVVFAFRECRWEIPETKKKGGKMYWAQMAMMASRWSY